MQYQETETLNLKSLANNLSDECRDILFSLPEESWKEENAIREFLEMTLDFEKRFAERMRFRTEDIEFKLELTTFTTKLKRLLADCKKMKITPNEQLQQILNFRQELQLFHRTLQGN